MTPVEERQRRCLLCQALFTEPRRRGRPRQYCHRCGPIMDAMQRRKAAQKYRVRKRQKERSSERVAHDE